MAGRLASKRVARLALKRVGVPWWAWPALWIISRTSVPGRIDQLLHRLHLVPGGYLVPTTWLCEWLQRRDKHRAVAP